MPSWSPSDTPPEMAATPPKTDTATAIERARRLLVLLLMGRQPDDPPQRPDK